MKLVVGKVYTKRKVKSFSSPKLNL